MKKVISLILTLILIISSITFAVANDKNEAPAKYVFLFIGDGMASPQITAAEYFLGTVKNSSKTFPKRSNLSFTDFQSLGIMTTMDATSFVPDSASAATSMASGIKTASGVLNYTVNEALEPQETLKTIAEYAKDSGQKIGIVTSVTTNHATPAAFYSKAPSRNDYYNIAIQAVSTKTVDFLCGGSFINPDNKGKDKNVYDFAKEAGITIVDKDINAIINMGKQEGRTIVISNDGAMPYEIDRLAAEAKGEKTISLADCTSASIKALDNENGFFIMVEGGKIDWSCHANDAYTTIMDTIAFSDAVQVANEFMKKHPDDTLIVVTGDHETGGLTIGYAGTEYSSHYEILKEQKLSYEKFEEIIASWRKDGKSFEAALNFVNENFGLTTEANKLTSLNANDIKNLKEAFEISMVGLEKANQNDSQKLAYGGYEPFSTAVYRIINNKAGLDFASYSHTGLQMPVYASGVSSKLFEGSYDNTDIFHKLFLAMGLKK